MKAFLGLALAVAAFSAQAQAAPVSVKAVHACLVQEGIIPESQDIIVIEFDKTSLRVEVKNKGDAASGFLANMTVKNDKLFYYDVVNDVDVPCEKTK